MTRRPSTTTSAAPTPRPPSRQTASAFASASAFSAVLLSSALLAQVGTAEAALLQRHLVPPSQAHPSPITSASASTSHPAFHPSGPPCNTTEDPGCVSRRGPSMGAGRFSVGPAAAAVPTAACELGGVTYAATTRGLARVGVGGALDVIASAGFCGDEDDGGGGGGGAAATAAVARVSCRAGVARGLLYNPLLAEACVSDGGFAAYNTSASPAADGTQGGRGIHVDPSLLPTATEDFTLAVWMRYDEPAPSADASDAVDVLSLNGAVLRVEAWPGYAVVSCGLQNPPGAALNATAAYNATYASLRTPRNYACVRDAGAGVTLFVDGAAAGVAVAPEAAFAFALPSRAPPAAAGGGVVSSTGRLVYLEDLRVYRRAVSAGQLRSLCACAANGPAAAVHCDAERGLVFFGAGAGALPGTCRARAFDPATGGVSGVRATCPALLAEEGEVAAAARANLHAVREVGALVPSGVDLLVVSRNGAAAAAATVAVAPLNQAYGRGVAGADTAFVSDAALAAEAPFFLSPPSSSTLLDADGTGCACADPRGVVFHVHASTGAVSVLVGRYGGGPLFHEFFSAAAAAAPAVALPVSACAASHGSLLLGDARGVVQVDRVSRRGARVAALGGGGVASLHLTPDTGAVVVTTAGGGVVRLEGLLRRTLPSWRLLYGQAAGGRRAMPAAAAASTDESYSVVNVAVSAPPQETLARVRTTVARACERECSGAAACTGFVWRAGAGECVLTTTPDFAALPAGDGVYLLKTAAVAGAEEEEEEDAASVFTPGGRLESATMAGMLGVVPHAACDGDGAVYVVGGHRLLRVDAATGDVQHLVGTGEASAEVAADTADAGPSTPVVDGPLTCVGDVVYLGQPLHSCVRAYNTTDRSLGTIAGTCGVDAGRNSTNGTAGGWVDARTAMAAPTGLSAHPTDASLLLVSTPEGGVVWEVDVAAGAMRSVFLNATDDDDAADTAAAAAPTDAAYASGGAALLIRNSPGGVAAGRLVLQPRPSDRAVFPVRASAALSGRGGGGDSSSAAGENPQTRALLAAAGLGDVAPAAAAHFTGSAKPSLAAAGAAAYLPAGTCHAALHAVSLATGDLARFPRLPAAMYGVTVGGGGGGDSLLVGGRYVDGGEGAVWRASGLPAAALRLGAGGGGRASFEGLVGARAFGLRLRLRADEAVGAGNWTCVLGVGGSDLLLGAAEDRILLAVGGESVAAAAPGVADGLWHDVAVRWRAGRWSVRVDGGATATAAGTGLAAGFEFPAQPATLRVGCGRTARSDAFGAFFTLVPAAASVSGLQVALVDAGGARVEREASWELNGDLTDRGGFGQHLVAAEVLAGGGEAGSDGAGLFTDGPELPTYATVTVATLSQGAVEEVAEGEEEGEGHGRVWSADGPCDAALRLEAADPAVPLSPGLVAAASESSNHAAVVVSAWVKPGGGGGGGDVLRVADTGGRAGGSSSGFTLRLVAGDSTGGSLLAPSADAGAVACGAASRVPHGVWTHLHARFDLRGGDVVLWINGAESARCGNGGGAAVAAGEAPLPNRAGLDPAAATVGGGGFAGWVAGARVNVVVAGGEADEVDEHPPPCPMSCRVSRRRSGVLRRSGAGVGGATMYADAVRLDAAQAQSVRLGLSSPSAAARTAPSRKGFSVGAWVGLDAAAAAAAAASPDTPVLLFGVLRSAVPAEAAPPGGVHVRRWCVDGVRDALAGDGRRGSNVSSASSSFSAAEGGGDGSSSSPPPPPLGGVGTACSASRGDAVASDVRGEVPRRFSAAANVWFADAAPAWPQPILHLTSSTHPSRYYATVTVGPAVDNGLVGRWCAGADPFSDAGPDNRRLVAARPAQAEAHTFAAEARVPSLSTAAAVATRACAMRREVGPLAAYAADSTVGTVTVRTVMAWVRLSAGGDASHGDVSVVFEAARAGPSPEASGPRVRVGVGQCAGGFCALFLDVAGDGVGGLPRASVAAWPRRSVPQGRWAHVAATFAATGEASLYVDGALTARRTVAATAATGATSYAVGGTLAGGDGVAGTLHDVRAYAQVLPAEQVLAAARRTETVGVGVLWRHADEDTAVKACPPAASASAMFPVNQWVSVAAAFDSGGAVWTQHAGEGSGGGVVTTDCAPPAGSGPLGRSDLHAFLDVAVVGASGGAVRASAFLDDVRLYAEALTPQDAATWVSARLRGRRQRDWAAAVFVEPATGHPTLYLAGHRTLRCDAAVSGAAAGARHFAASVSPEKFVWYVDGVAACEVAVRDGALPPVDVFGSGWLGGSPLGHGLSGFLGGVYVTEGAVDATENRLHMRGRPLPVAAAAAAATHPCSFQSLLPLRGGSFADDLSFRVVDAVGGGTAEEEGKEAEGTYFHPDQRRRLVSKKGWDGLAGAPEATVSVWARPAAAEGGGGGASSLSVLVGSTREDGPRWAEGGGPAAVPGARGCAQAASTVFRFAFAARDVRRGVVPSLSGDACGGGGARGNNRATVLRNVVPASFAPPGGGSGGSAAAAALSGGRVASIGGLARAEGGTTSAGMTVMFWVRHEEAAAAAAAAASVHTHDSIESRVLYEVMKEGDSGRAIVALRSRGGGGRRVGFGFRTASAGGEGGQIVEMAGSDAFAFGVWEHVAVRVGPGEAVAVFRGGVRVWGEEDVGGGGGGGSIGGVVAAANATAPWAWGVTATVTGHVSAAFSVQQRSSCGGGAFHAAAGGGNETYLTGSVEACKEACNAHAGCSGFVYVHPGDDAPAHRCYFRTGDVSGSSGEAQAAAYRDCYAKVQAAERIPYTVAEMTVVDRPLSEGCIAAEAAATATTTATTSTATATEDAASCCPPPPASAVMFHAGGGGEGAAEASRELRLPGRDGSRGLRVDGAGSSVDAATGHARLRGPASLTLDAGCVRFTRGGSGAAAAAVAEDAQAGNGTVVASLAELEARPYTRDAALPLLAESVYALRVEATGGGDGGGAVALGLHDPAAPSGAWVSVTVPAGSGRRWFSGVGVSGQYGGGNETALALPDLIGLGLAAPGGTGGDDEAVQNVTVHAVELCAVHDRDSVCGEWGCSCQEAADAYGMGGSGAAVSGEAGCADRVVQAWWAGRCVSGNETYRPALQPPPQVPAMCALPRQALALALRMRAVAAPAEAEAETVATEEGGNCTVAHEVFRSASRLETGVFRLLLCAAADDDGDASGGRLAVHGGFHKVPGAGLRRWGGAGALVTPGRWTHVAVAVDGGRAAVYLDGALVYASSEGGVDGDASPLGGARIRTHRTAQLFPSEHAASAVDVAEVVVLQGARHCAGVFQALARSGGTGPALHSTPCPLAPEAPLAGLRELGGLVMYHSFNDPWLAAAGRRMPDESGEGNDLVAASPRFAASGGAADAGAAADVRGGGALRLTDAALSPARAPPAHNAFTLAMWLCVFAGDEAGVATLFAEGDAAYVVSVGAAGGDDDDAANATLAYADASSGYGYTGGNATAGRGGASVRVGVWHHLLLVRRATDATLYVNGRVADASGLARLPVVSAQPAALLSTPAAAGGGVVAFADDVAMWSRALSPAEAAAAYRHSIGHAELSPGVWHHVVWTLAAGGEQAWLVDGRVRRRCRGAAGGVGGGGGDEGAGALVLGRHGERHGFHGRLRDLELHSRGLTVLPQEAAAAAAADTSSAPVLASLRRRRGKAGWPKQQQRQGTRHTHAPAVVSAALEEAWAASEAAAAAAAAAARRKGAAAAAAAAVVPEAERCGGCSEACGDACHRSLYRFEEAAVGRVMGDAWGGGRSVSVRGAATVQSGLRGSVAVEVC